MFIGITADSIYTGGAIVLGLVALIFLTRTISQAKASRERLRRIRRTLEGAR